MHRFNYSDHAAETGAEALEPIYFKNDFVIGPNDDVEIPKTSATDWEVELGIIIGKKAKYISEGSSQYIAGYCVVNDISERDFPRKRSGQWTKESLVTPLVQ